ncbi:MAG TPA: RIP metalloprotease RseP [bacterium]|jgi:regulator of sigma E protease|nr:RIP metalloprotease RseP [bacterium]
MNIIHLVEVILFFSFMIFIHESGHFLAARLFDVEVEEFALGFGPTLLSRKVGKTLYAIRSVPLGGFCKMQGGDLSSNSAEEMYSNKPVAGDFLFASWWKRIVILLAGPGMNFLTALLVIAMLFAVAGEQTEVAQPLLGFVPPGSLAEKAGLKKGDLLLTVNGKVIDNLNTADELLPDYGKSSVITYQRGNNKNAQTATIERGSKPLSEWAASDNALLKMLASIGWGPAPVDATELGIQERKDPIVGQAVLSQPARNAGIQEGDFITQINGQKVSDWSELAYLIRNAKTTTLQVEFIRDKALHTVTIQPVFNGFYKAIGVSPVDNDKLEVKKVSIVTAFADSGKITVGMSKTIFDGIVKLFSGQVSLKDNAAGPITIMRLMYQRASQGWVELMNSVAMISLMLFIMNLLPIPVVDGGQIVLCLIEGVKRSPVSVKAQLIYQQVGFVLIVGLMLLVIFNDFKNIFLEMHNHIR